MAGERAYPTGYEAVLPYIAHLHVKDARATDNGKLEWTVVGEGEIDWAGQIKALKEAGFTGALSLETHYRGPNGDMEEASRQCLAGLKRLIEAA
jgi:sugar phosphate isomerase/epimerase